MLINTCPGSHLGQTISAKISNFSEMSTCFLGIVPLSNYPPLYELRFQRFPYFANWFLTSKRIISGSYLQTLIHFECWMEIVNRPAFHVCGLSNHSILLVPVCWERSKNKLPSCELIFSIFHPQTWWLEGDAGQQQRLSEVGGNEADCGCEYK